MCMCEKLKSKENQNTTHIRQASSMHAIFSSSSASPITIHYHYTATQKKKKTGQDWNTAVPPNADIIQQRNSTFFHHHNLNPKEIKKLCKLDRKYVCMCLGNSRIIKPWNFALQRDGKCAWNSRIKKPWNFYNNFVWNNLRKSLEIEESVRKVPPSLSPSLTARMEEITNETHPPN